MLGSDDFDLDCVGAAAGDGRDLGLGTNSAIWTRALPVAEHVVGERLVVGHHIYVAHHGLADVSLRTLAAALGTSHRMLIHHFGSKERLWIEIVRTVEARQRELLGEIVPNPDQPIADAMHAWWKHISDPSLWPNERLFFEIYGQALQGRPHTTELLDGIVDDWLDSVTEINVGLGVPPELARAHARLGVAVTRGLLLDLLATRDTAGIDAAMEAFIDVYTSWLNAAAAVSPARSGRAAPARSPHRQGRSLQ